MWNWHRNPKGSAQGASDMDVWCLKFKYYIPSSLRTWTMTYFHLPLRTEASSSQTGLTWWVLNYFWEWGAFIDQIKSCWGNNSVFTPPTDSANIVPIVDMGESKPHSEGSVLSQSFHSKTTKISPMTLHFHDSKLGRKIYHCWLFLFLLKKRKHT